MDYRDVCIEDQAAEIVLLEERLVEVTQERDRYREMAKAAIHALHDVTMRHDRLQGRLRQMHEARRDAAHREAA